MNKPRNNLLPDVDDYSKNNSVKTVSNFPVSLVQDNWPAPLHPEVLARLIPHPWVFPGGISATWPTTTKNRWSEAQHVPGTLVLLPTYAPWTNPIDRRWRRQDVLPLHRLADDWDGLQTNVSQVLDQFAQGGPQALLRYGGLSDLGRRSRGV